MPPLEFYRPGPGAPPPRPSVPERYRWDLSPVCASWEEWTERYAQLETLIESFRQFQGTLGQSGARLLEALRAKRRSIQKLLIASGAGPSRLNDVIEAARRSGVRIERRDRRGYTAQA